jgi:hypothetical protein
MLTALVLMLGVRRGEASATQQNPAPVGLNTSR